MLVEYRLSSVDGLFFCPQSERWVDRRACNGCGCLKKTEQGPAGDVVVCRPALSRVADLIEMGEIRDRAVIASTHPLRDGRTLIVADTNVTREDGTLVATFRQGRTYHYAT